jgi:2-phospho-L-lactate guanylyltransferase
MDFWAVIPVKSFALGKSRLAGILGTEQRTALNRRLFGRMLDTALGLFKPDRIAVVTGDRFLLALVRGQGLHGLDDTGGGLNEALGLACRFALARRARAIAVLPSDLPFVGRADLEALTAALDQSAGCVIAPDAQEQGTNALALAPPDPDFFRFGAQSFQAHLESAKARKLRVHVLRRPGLARDLDTPDDYRQFANGQFAASGVPA